MSVLIDVLFWALGVVAILSGAAVFWVDSMARASYALALSFVAVGVQVLFLQQNYVGVIAILMMIMEMAIMAVYMVMFMG
ncbi:MAG TPA: NADH:ubiquinone oxidoreductase subunit J, partial [Beutenbergiaceae bacterium]|nr:NADH:ubiquinone oxidoreductase subunit J [Beutenbergiaceae bacterium]